MTMDAVIAMYVSELQAYLFHSKTFPRHYSLCTRLKVQILTYPYDDRNMTGRWGTCKLSHVFILHLSIDQVSIIFINKNNTV